MAPFVSSFSTALSGYTNDIFVTRFPYALTNVTGTFVDVVAGLNVNVAASPSPAQTEQSKPAAGQKPAASESALDRLDKQVESLNAQLGELRHAMQELRPRRCRRSRGRENK